MSVQGKKEWTKIPKARQELLLKNVFCNHCGETRILR
ncbi:hypothetical protein IGJ66_001069 [Enterococcus sp. DIV0176]